MQIVPVRKWTRTTIATLFERYCGHIICSCTAGVAKVRFRRYTRGISARKPPEKKPAIGCAYLVVSIIYLTPCCGGTASGKTLMGSSVWYIHYSSGFFIWGIDESPVIVSWKTQLSVWTSSLVPLDESSIPYSNVVLSNFFLSFTKNHSFYHFEHPQQQKYNCRVLAKFEHGMFFLPDMSMDVRDGRRFSHHVSPYQQQHNCNIYACHTRE